MVWRTCGRLALLSSVYLREAYIKHGDCHIAGKIDDQCSEVVMGKTEHYFHKHTQGTWLSACDNFGHTNWQDWHRSCSLCVISGLFYTLKVKLKNKWIYRTHKSPQANVSLRTDSGHLEDTFVHGLTRCLIRHWWNAARSSCPCDKGYPWMSRGYRTRNDRETGQCTVSRHVFVICDIT